MAADVAPGLQRHGEAAPTRWLGFDATAWTRLRRGGARARSAPGAHALRPAFFGSDLDPHAIRAARENAAAAARRSMARERSLAAFDDAREVGQRCCGRARGNVGVQRGLVVCNPPYDARLAADTALYRALGDALKRAVPDLARQPALRRRRARHATGLRAQQEVPAVQRRDRMHADRLRSDRTAAARAREQPRALSEGAQMVANRLRKNLRKLKTWREREGVDLLPRLRCRPAGILGGDRRLHRADEPRPRTFLHVQEYAAPPRSRKPTCAAASTNCWPRRAKCSRVPREHIATEDARARQGRQQVRRSSTRAAKLLTVREGDARLRVNLFDYLDTGLFLDHRPLRLRIADEARGHALPQPVRLHRRGHRAGGGRPRARRPPRVDLSATYLQWCADNLRENGFGGARHRLVQADALAWLEADTQRVRPDLLRPADVLQFRARRRFRRAARARAPAARGGGAPGRRAACCTSPTTSAVSGSMPRRSRSSPTARTSPRRPFRRISRAIRASTAWRLHRPL